MKELIVQDQNGIIRMWLRGRIEGITQNQLDTLFFQNRILLNGTISSPDSTIKKGDCITVILREKVGVIAENMSLTTLFEDEQVLVIDKPSGIPVHPGLGHWSGSVLNGIQYKLENGTLQSKLKAEEMLVHRLDKGTSGVLIIAKDSETRGALMEQFVNNKIQKEYKALVNGIPSAKQGEIELYIGRVPGDSYRLDWSLEKTFGKYSFTKYEVEKVHPKYSKLSLYPETGRTHQLRLHCLWLGHPILGDTRYTTTDTPTYPCNRLALHASALLFQHPIEKKAIRIESSWPKELNLE
jgi:23S rRNA pseudouridine1911/1915/1917 synthase